MPKWQWLIGALALSLSAGAASAGQPFSIYNPQNTYTAVVDAQGIHFVCDSGCSTGSSTSPTGQAVPGSATYIGVNVGGILTGWDKSVTEASGANVVLGSLTDAASCTSGQSILACLRLINTNVSGSIPAGAALIGKVGFDQTTPGTTNAVSVAYVGSTATATGNGATSTGTQRVTLSLDNTSVSFDVSTATTTQIVAASGSTVIHVQHWGAVAAAAQTVKWVSADTGGACANPVALSGVMSFAANGGASMGSGAGDILVAPSGKALCMVTTTTGQTGGSVSYRQF